MACADHRISIEGSVAARWLEPIARLCARLATMKDVDPSARLRITAAADDVTIESVLADGRTAQRRIHSTDELGLTLEALVVIPPSVPRGELERGAQTSPPAAKVAQPVPSAARPDPARMRIEVGGMITGRMEQPPTYLAVGLDVYSDLCFSSWLFGLGVRWDTIELATGKSPPAFIMDTVGAAFLVGRRLALAPALNLDAGAKLLLLSQTQSSELGTEETTESRADVRLGLLARALFGPTHWRWTLALETDFSPGRLRQSIRLAPSFPILPTWSIGVGVGAIWGDT